MLGHLISAAIVSASAMMPVCAPDDDLDRALRVVTSLDELVEGVDFTYVVIGGVEYVSLTDEACYTQHNLRCTDQKLPCAYLAATTVCVYCDGLSGGFAWTATNGLCTTSTSSSCTVNPGGITNACGKQRRSTCGGAPGSLTCTTVGTASNKDCKPKECT